MLPERVAEAAEKPGRIQNDKASGRGRKVWRDARLFLENSTVCQIVDAIWLAIEVSPVRGGVLMVVGLG